MSYRDLIIINNEKIFKENNSFYCDNLDLKVLPEGLSEYYKVHYIVRKSNKKGEQKINLKNIKVASNVINFIYFILKTIRIPNASYLIISITPFTFFSFLILFLLRKRMFVYIYSSGQEEYQHILGSWSVWIYQAMYKLVTSNSKIIVCHERLFDKEKAHLVNISRLDNEWIQNYKNPSLDKVKFLYVGRMSPEKGIFEFLKMFNQIEFDAEFSIVGNSNNKNIEKKNINLLGYISDQKSLINIYDEHNIMVLPSFTDAAPYVLDEALARRRPVIIFEDIKYIVKDKKGIFVSKRDLNSFSKTTKYIMDNYYEIQKKMEKNVLPTRKSMIKQISDIINFQNSKL